MTKTKTLNEMRIHITARHLHLTDALRDYVTKKVSKCQKYFDHLIWAQVILSVEKVTHKCEIVVHASLHTFRALAQSQDLYAAVDLASDKIDGQIKKHKERTRGHHKDVSMLPAVAEEVTAAPETRFSVIKQVPVWPMTKEEAARQMENLGYDFWLFLDQGTKQVSVVYRRLDNSYGLMQPVKR
jgi:putative sigma-54 modulation protein